VSEVCGCRKRIVGLALLLYIDEFVPGSYVPARVSFELKVRMVWFSSRTRFVMRFFGPRALDWKCT
jgi:hypothetical protein